MLRTWPSRSSLSPLSGVLTVLSDWTLQGEPMTGAEEGVSSMHMANPPAPRKKASTWLSWPQGGSSWPLGVVLTLVDGQTLTGEHLRDTTTVEEMPSMNKADPPSRCEAWAMQQLKASPVLKRDAIFIILTCGATSGGGRV